MTCEHHNFKVNAKIARLHAQEGGPVTGFVAEIRVECADCGKPFQFLGLQAGVDTQGARVSVDGLEANIAISPEGELPNPLERMAARIGWSAPGEATDADDPVQTVTGRKLDS